MVTEVMVTILVGVPLVAASPYWLIVVDHVLALDDVPEHRVAGGELLAAVVHDDEPLAPAGVGLTECWPWRACRPDTGHRRWGSSSGIV